MHVMPFLLHSITLDWSIGLIPEFRFHLTNSSISRLDQTPKPLYFFPKKSRFSDLRKKGKIWSKWGGSNLNYEIVSDASSDWPSSKPACRRALGGAVAWENMSTRAREEPVGAANRESPRKNLLWRPSCSAATKRLRLVAGVLTTHWGDSGERPFTWATPNGTHNIA